MQPPKSRRLFWQIIGLVAVIGLSVALAVAFVDITAVTQTLRQVRPLYLLVASLFLLLGLVFFAARWRFLLQNKPSFLHTFHASNIGHAANLLIPGRVGEGIRIVVMGQGGVVSYTEAASSFVVERLFEQIMRLLALVTAVALGSGLEITPGSIVGGILLVALLLGFIFWLTWHREWTLARGTAVLSRLPRLKPETVHHWLTDLLDNLQYVATAARLGQGLGWSLLSWASFGAFFYVTLLAFGDAVPAADRLPIAVGTLALSPPSAPTTPGFFHGSVVAPLTAVGFSPEFLLAYAIILHVIEMFWNFLLALWGLAVVGLSVIRNP